MTKAKSFLLTAVAVSAMAAVTSAGAATLILHGGEGWQLGIDSARNAAQTTPSVLKLVVTGAGGAYFSFSDCCVVGDVYKIGFNNGFGTLTTTTTFSGYSTPFVNNLGPYASTFAPDWLNNSFSHFQILLTAGTYKVTVKDTHLATNGTYPAGFGFRLDNNVPEPATWALMLGGVFGVGASLRARRKSALAA